MLEYTVTAEDGTQNKYAVSAIKEATNEDTNPKIIAFKVAYNDKEYEAFILGGKIHLSGLPSNVDFSKITPIVGTTDNTTYSPQGSLDATTTTSVEYKMSVSKNGVSRSYSVYIDKLIGY